MRITLAHDYNISLYLATGAYYSGKLQTCITVADGVSKEAKDLTTPYIYEAMLPNVS